MALLPGHRLDQRCKAAAPSRAWTRCSLHPQTSIAMPGPLFVSARCRPICPSRSYIILSAVDVRRPNDWIDAAAQPAHVMAFSKAGVTSPGHEMAPARFRMERSALVRCCGSGGARGGPFKTGARSTSVGRGPGCCVLPRRCGATSVPSGRVSISRRLPFNGCTGDRLILTWRETGGPLVTPPSKSGYGMDVVRELVPFELGGTVDHVFTPEGARCQIEIPLAPLSGASSHGKPPTSAYAMP
jgi:hypothetical protein